MSDALTPPIARRKSEHIEIAASGRADFMRSQLLEHVHLVHQALPELAEAELDLRVKLAGKVLAAPFVITGMTGGTQAASSINRDLASVAAQLGIAFGVGSQRAMAEHPELTETYAVKETAPDVVLIGNIGGVQAQQLGAARVAELAKRIGADLMAVHLNPAQEMIQRDGDRDFRGVRDALARLRDVLPIPLWVKETGCGLSFEAAQQLRRLGIEGVDVAGAGGTSWVAVEAERAEAGSVEAALGQQLWDWGLPTAVSVAACAQQGLAVIASGGLRSGHDVARAIALGAVAGGMAAPVLRAHRDGGRDGAVRFLEDQARALRTILLLTGCRRPEELARAPRHVGAPLRDFLGDLGLSARPAAAPPLHVTR
jgi:isopentenyl-diphosphate Delta-isomerase